MMRGALEALEQGATVVTANRRLALLVTRAYNREREAAGERVWDSPRALSWEAWCLAAWRRLRDAGDPAAAGRVALSDAQALRTWRAVLETGSPGLVDVVSAARTASEANDLLTNWRLAPEEALTHQDPQQFAGLLAGYARRLSARGLADGPARLRSLAAAVGPEEGGVVFVGFESPTPMQTWIGERIGASLLEDDEAPASRSIERLAFADPQRELQAAAGWLRARYRPGARLGLVVPDLAGRRAAVDQALARVFLPAPVWDLPEPERLPWNLTLGSPLLEWPMIHTAVALLRLLVEPVDFTTVSRVLRSPWMADAPDGETARARLELDLRRANLTELDAAMLVREAERGACPGLAARLSGARRQLAGPGRRRPEAWAGLFSTLVTDLGWPGPRAVDTVAWQLGQAWGRALETLAGLASVTGELSATQAVADLVQVLAEQVFQPESGERPLEVMGVLEAQGQSFDALWVCGLHDQAWPPALKPNGFLPVSLQREAGMPRACPERELELGRRRMTRLAASAGEVRFSWPEAAGDEPLRPSPLIAGYAGGRYGSPTGDGAAGTADWAERIFAARETEPMPESRWSPATGVRRGGLGLLTDQARCPFRAAAVHGLSARPPEVPAAGVDALSRGIWAHSALARLWSRWGSRSAAANLDASERARQVLDAVTEALKDTRLERRGLPAPLLEIERRRLAGLVGQLVDQDLQRPDFRVLATEETVTVTAGPLVLTGRLDRLDEDGGGRWVIDYKTGDASVADWFSERLREPQVPAYAVSVDGVTAVAFGVLRAGSPEYRGVVSGDEALLGLRPLARQRTPGLDDPDWEMLQGWWSERIAELGTGFAAGDAAVSPAGSRACRHCGLDVLCRRHELLRPGGDDDE